MVPNVEERVPGSHSFSFTGNVYGGRGQQRLLFLSLLLQFWFELGPVATTDSMRAIGLILKQASPLNMYILEAESPVQGHRCAHHV